MAGRAGPAGAAERARGALSEEAAWAGESDEDPAGDPDAQIERLAEDLAVLGQKSPVARGLTIDLVKSLARGANPRETRRPDPDSGPAAAAKRTPEAAAAGQDADVFALLSDEPDERDRAARELERQGYAGPLFSSQVVDFYKARLSEHYTQTQDLTCTEPRKKLGRSVLDIVLAQLLLEGDVVLHRTLLRYPQFAAPGSGSASKRRKKTRRRSNSYLSGATPTTVAKAYDEVGSLLREAAASQSLVDYLIAAKFMLSVYSFLTQEPDDAFAAAVLQATHVNEEISDLATRTIPSSKEALAGLYQSLVLDAANMLGAVLPRRANSFLRQRSRKPPSSSRSSSGPSRYAYMRLGGGCTGEGGDDDDNEEAAESARSGPPLADEKSPGQEAAHAPRSRRPPGVAVSLLSGRSVAIDQRDLAVSVPAYMLLESNQDKRVKFRDFRCDGCTSPGALMGHRLECACCVGYDLCLECFLADEHSPGHAFHIHHKPGGSRILLPPRSAPKLSIVGIPCAAQPLGELGDAVLAWEAFASVDTPGARIGCATLDCDFDLAGHRESGLGGGKGSWGLELSTGRVWQAGELVATLNIPDPPSAPTRHDEEVHDDEIDNHDDTVHEGGETDHEDESDSEGDEHDEDDGTEHRDRTFRAQGSEGPFWRVLCWIDARARRAGFVVDGHAVDFALDVDDDGAALVPAASLRNDFRLSSLGHVSFGVDLETIRSTWFASPRKDLMLSEDRLQCLARAVRPSCLFIPRGDALSCAALVDPPGFRTATKLSDEFTFEAMICWTPSAYGTPESAAQVYTLLSRADSLTGERARHPCTQIGIVADGYLFVQLQSNDFCTWSHRAVVVPGKWQHIRVAVFGRSYRGPSVRFVVDDTTIHADARRRKPPAQASLDNVERDSEPKANRKPNFWTASSRAHCGAWVLGAQPSLPSLAEDANSDAGASSDGESGNDGADPPDADARSSFPTRDEDQEHENVPEVANQFQGYFAEARVWKRSLGSRESSRLGGRVLTLGDTNSSSSSSLLLFRFRVDEMFGRRIFRASDGSFETGSSLKLYGQACLDPNRISNDLSSAVADLEASDGAAADAQKITTSQDAEDLHVEILEQAGGLCWQAGDRISCEVAKQHLASRFLSVLGHLLRITAEFTANHKDLKSSVIGIRSPVCSVHPTVHTFLLLQSLLRQLLREAEEEGGKTSALGWMLVAALQMLRDNLRALLAQGVLPAAVGLGFPSQNVDAHLRKRKLSGEPNVVKLRTTLLRIVEESTRFKDSRLRESIQEEALVCLGEGLTTFYAPSNDQRRLLVALFTARPKKGVATAAEARAANGQGLVPTTGAARDRLLAVVTKSLAAWPARLTSLLRLPEPARGAERGRRGGKLLPSLAGADSPSMPCLRWSVQFVQASLNSHHASFSPSVAAAAANVDLSGAAQLTKREIIRYLQAAAPSDWLEKHSLDRNEMAVAKDFPSDRIAELYSILESSVSSGSVVLNAVDAEDENGQEAIGEASRHASIVQKTSTRVPEGGRGGDADSKDTSWPMQLVHISLTGAAGRGEAQTAAVQLLRAILSFMHEDVWGAASPSRPQHEQSPVLIETFLRTGFTGARRGDFTIAEGKSVQAPANPEPGAASEVPWWEAPLARNGEPTARSPTDAGSRRIPLRAGSASRRVRVEADGVSMTHLRGKSWGTAASSVGYAKHSGIYSWKVKITRCNGKGHMFVGVIGKGTRVDTFIGSDNKSYGFLLAGDVYYNSKATQRGAFPRQALSTGSTVLLKLDTDALTLEVADANRPIDLTTVDNAKSLGTFKLPDLFQASDDGRIYPAICTYDEGDAASFIAYADDTSPQGHWMLNTRLLKDRVEWARARLLCVEDCMETIIAHAGANARRIAPDILYSMLSFPVAWVLLWPVTNLVWAERVRAHLQIVLRSMLRSSADGEVSNMAMLTSAAYGKLCSLLITASPSSQLSRPRQPGSNSSSGLSPTLRGSRAPASTGARALSEDSGAALRDGDDATGARSDDDTEEEDSAPLQRWVTSSLLSRGLQSSGCLLSDAQVRAPASAATSLLPGQGPLVESESKDSHTSKNAGLPEHVEDLIYNRGRARALHRWLYGHLNFAPRQVRETGDGEIARITNGLIVAMLHHTGWLSVALQMAQGLEEVGSAEKISNVRPHSELVAIWRAAIEGRSWLLRQQQSSAGQGASGGGGGGGGLFASVTQATRFLFMFAPAVQPLAGDAAAGTSTSALAAFREALGLPARSAAGTHSESVARMVVGRSGQAGAQTRVGAGGLETSPPALEPTFSLPLDRGQDQARFLARSRSLGASSSTRSSWTMGQMLENGSVSRANGTFQDILAQVNAFIHDIASSNAVTVNRLHSRFVALCTCARTRERGFRSLAASLLSIPFSAATQALHAAMLVTVPSALRGWSGGSPEESRKGPWHYLEGLEASGTDAQLALASGFAALGRALAELLQASAVLPARQSTGLQLELLDTLGVRLAPVDHELLAKTSLLEVLHRIMESNREAIDNAQEMLSAAARPAVETSSASSEQAQEAGVEVVLSSGPDEEPPAGEETDGFAGSRDGEAPSAEVTAGASLLAHQCVGRAALKTFYLLCSQVAAFRPSGVSVAARVGPRTAFLPRVRSGPESLNTSVFDLLLRELSAAVDSLEDIVSLSSSLPSRNQPATMGLTDSHHADAKLHMEEITSVLLSTCTFSSCQRQICSPEWLDLLCNLAQHGPVSVQQNIFRIFRRMLPLVDPEPLHSGLRTAGAPGMESFLLDLVAVCFEPVACAKLSDATLSASFEAMRTLRKLQRARAWRARVHTALKDAIEAGHGVLASSDGSEENGAAAAVKAHSSASADDTASADANTDAGGELEEAGAHTLARCIAALAVVSGTLRKLLPGVPVRALERGGDTNNSAIPAYCLVWSDKDSRELGELESLDVWRHMGDDPGASALIAADGRRRPDKRKSLQRVTLGAEYVFPARDRNLISVDAASPLLAAIRGIFVSALPLAPWKSPHWPREFTFSHHANKSVNVHESPSESSAVLGTIDEKESADGQSSCIQACARVGQWVQLVNDDASGARDSSSAGPRWVKVQDAENDYIMRPVLKDPEAASKAFQASLVELYTLQALSAVSVRDCAESEASLASLLPRETSLNELLEIALEEAAGFRASDLDVLAERLSIVVDELGRGRQARHPSDASSVESAGPGDQSASEPTDILAVAAENASDLAEAEPNRRRQARSGTRASSSSTRAGARAGARRQRPGVPAESILALMDMGFPRRWARYALEQNELDVTAAITYICALGEELDERIALSLSQAEEAQSEDEDGEEEEDDDEEEEGDAEVAEEGARSGEGGAPREDSSRAGASVEEMEQSSSGGDATSENASKVLLPDSKTQEKAPVKGASFEDDYLEMDGEDVGSGDKESNLVASYALWDNRGQARGFSDGSSGSGSTRRGSGSRVRDEWTKHTSEMQRAYRRQWGPCADSRASYRHLLESYSQAELFEEFRYLAQVMTTLQARVLVLRTLITDGDQANGRIPEEKKAGLVRMLVSESFQTFPMYGLDCLESITCGDKATLWNIPQSVHEFVGSCIQSSSAFVDELLTCVKQTLRRAATADFYIDAQLARDELAPSAESSESLLWFVDWATRQLLRVAPLGSSLHLLLFKTWLLALRSPSVSIKISALGMLADFLDAAASMADADARAQALKQMLELLPRPRLVALAARLLARRDGQKPGPSAFCKALLYINAKLEQYAPLVDGAIFSAQPSRLELGKEGFVELRDVNGQPVDPLQPPWTVSVWLRSSAEASGSRDALAEPQVILGDSSGQGSALQVVMTSFGPAVQSSQGKVSGFGFNLAPRAQEASPWTQVTLVCEDFPHLDALREMHISPVQQGSLARRKPAADERAENGGEDGSNRKGEGVDSGLRDDDGDEGSEKGGEEVDDTSEEDDDGDEDEDWVHAEDLDDIDSFLSDGVFQMNNLGVEAYIQFNRIAQRQQREQPAPRRGGITPHIQRARRAARAQSPSKLRKKPAVHIFAYVDGKLRGSVAVHQAQAALGLREIGGAAKPSFSGQVGRVCVWRRAMDRVQVREAFTYLNSLEPRSFCRALESGTGTADALLDGDDLHSCWDFTQYTLQSGAMRLGAEEPSVLGHLLPEGRRHAHVGVLRAGARLSARDDVILPAVALSEKVVTRYESIDPRYQYLVDGVDFSGVILWDLEGSPLAHSLAVPFDFQEAHLPVRMHLRLLEGGEIRGHLECKEQNREVWCALDGALDNDRIRLSVSQVVRGDKHSHAWLSGLVFEGTEDRGELQGTWTAARELPHFAELPEDSPVLRAVARYAAAYLDLGDAGTSLRSRCDVLRFVRDLPPFVVDQRPIVSTSNTIVLESGKWAHVFATKPGRDNGPLGSQGDDEDGGPAGTLEPTTWACPACTFLNEQDHSCCAICTTPNPEHRSEERGGDEGLLFGMDADGIWVPDSGSYVWEFRVHGTDAALRQGHVFFGVCRREASLREHLGSTEHSWGMSTDGVSWFKGRSRRMFSESLHDGDLVALELDTNTKVVRVFVNGSERGRCDRSFLVRGTGDFLLESPLSPAVSIAARATVEVDFLGLKHGDGCLEYEAPEKFASDADDADGNNVKAERLETRYEGAWQLGRRHGVGVSTWSDGSTEKGPWVNGQRHGLFTASRKGAMNDKNEKQAEELAVCYDRGEVSAHVASKDENGKQNTAPVDAETAAADGVSAPPASETRYAMSGTFAASCHQLVRLDPTTAGPGIEVSQDCLSAEFVASGPDTGKRSHVLGARGYSRGVHYWEARVLGMQWGSTLIGVTDRTNPYRRGSRARHRTGDVFGEGWGDGFGFVNYRATHSPDGEQLYGSFYAVNDVVGVLLDMDRGRLHFFKDFQDYQSGDRQVIVDLGLAYSQIRRKCRNGRRGRVDPESIKFYPCFGFSKARDRITLQDTRGLELRGPALETQVQEFAGTVNLFRQIQSPTPEMKVSDELAEELALRWARLSTEKGPSRTVWSLGRIPVKLWVDPAVCAAACPTALGPLRVGDRLQTRRGPVTVLGARAGALWYAVDGSDQALFWSPAELRGHVKDGKVRREGTDGGEPDSAQEVTKAAREASRSGAEGVEDSPSDWGVTLASLLDACRGVDASSTWTDGLDHELIAVINRLCDRQACEPEHLRPAQILAELKHSETEAPGMRRLLAVGDARILSRFTTLLVLNSRMRKLFELADLALEGAAPGQVRCALDARTPDGAATPERRANSMSIPELLSCGRTRIFTRVKLEFWNAAIEWTTTPTVPAADEYDAPPDFPVVRVNRIMAGDQRLTALEETERLQTSVFGQLMVEGGMETWPSRRLRRSYSHIQDATQQRCFFVKFESEGVDDHGGPYRAVFQIAIEEEAAGPLQVLMPCPNAADGALANADRMIFSELRQTLDADEGDASDTSGPAGDSSSQDANGLSSRRRAAKSASRDLPWPTGAAGSERCVRFLGRLLGVATRHGIHVGLSLAHLIWRPLVGLPVGWRELHEIDSFTARSLRQIEALSREQWADEDAAWSELLLDRLGPSSALLPSGCVVAEAGRPPSIPYEARSVVVEAIVRECLTTAAAPVSVFMQGLAQVLPTELFVLFTPDELERLICGAPEIDVDLLKRATVYEDVDPEAPHVAFFWEALEDMTQEERSKFVNFVCARSRLPPSVDKFPMNFKIISLARKQESDQGADADAASKDDLLLPQSQTCFFTLGLPEYSSKEVCFQKLLYAANNCNTMEDFDEHDAQAFSGLT